MACNCIKEINAEIEVQKAGWKLRTNKSSGGFRMTKTMEIIEEPEMVLCYITDKNNKKTQEITFPYCPMCGEKYIEEEICE